MCMCINTYLCMCLTTVFMLHHHLILVVHSVLFKKIFNFFHFCALFWLSNYSLVPSSVLNALFHCLFNLVQNATYFMDFFFFVNFKFRWFLCVLANSGFHALQSLWSSYFHFKARHMFVVLLELVCVCCCAFLTGGT